MRVFWITLALGFSLMACSQDKELGIGDTVPHVVLQDQYDSTIRLSDLVRQGTVVLYFYPKDDTPGCTKEACTFRDEYEKFTDLGVVVVGISADSPESHLNFAKKHKLPFTLLSDPENETRKSFGVPANFMGMIPGRVTYVIDAEGVIRGVYNSQLSPTKHVEEALTVIKSL